MYIALFYWPNLTAEKKESVIALSAKQVGIPSPIESGVTDKYTRLRYIEQSELEAIMSVWTFPAHIEDETLPSYNARVKAETQAAFAALKANTHKAIWVKESGFQNLSRQPEFINS